MRFNGNTNILVFGMARFRKIHLRRLDFPYLEEGWLAPCIDNDAQQTVDRRKKNIRKGKKSNRPTECPSRPILTKWLSFIFSTGMSSGISGAKKWWREHVIDKLWSNYELAIIHDMLLPEVVSCYSPRPLEDATFKF